jgi:NitT/TauT family transport system substrate-binding protein
VIGADGREEGLMDRRSRRRFLRDVAGLGLSAAGLGALAGCGGLSAPIAPALGPAPLETTTLRTARSTSVCHSPQFLAEPLLRDEGFVDIKYVEPTPSGLLFQDRLAAGELDIMTLFSAPFILQVDIGSPVVFLAGLHVGCFELFGTSQIRSVRDLKGRTAGISRFRNADHVFLASMAAYVGLDPRVDIDWLVYDQRQPAQVLTSGQADALIGFPPIPQDLRSQQIGHVVVNSSTDKPWSQYFCCMIAAHQDFVQKHPVATKRALRAFLKATDLCAADPGRAAQYMVDHGHAQSLDYTRQALHEIPYARWREYDPEDAIRFYSLRLQEIGMIKSSPDTIIQRGTDWRFLNELKQELKA